MEMLAGYTLLQAAREHGIAIPALCYLESLAPYAAWGGIG
jgi:NADH dehydrogenase/NADH:ubiquinone oxidoreductase subunit G